MCYECLCDTFISRRWRCFVYVAPLVTVHRGNGGGNGCWQNGQKLPKDRLSLLFLIFTTCKPFMSCFCWGFFSHSTFRVTLTLWSDQHIGLRRVYIFVYIYLWMGFVEYLFVQRTNTYTHQSIDRYPFNVGIPSPAATAFPTIHTFICLITQHIELSLGLGILWWLEDRCSVPRVSGTLYIDGMQYKWWTWWGGEIRAIIIFV